ncbi:esterase/lipase family protein [Azorhizobium oxalatiphilum]|uniref:esterase/lipase family protein n=1 Tax=Azorhizobium oxalatiphilum TaxID=980631 RepID=UPI00166A8E39|nr:hypothetical protein [Azorhizobium oxalatiphilum]
MQATEGRPVVVLIHGIRDYGLWQQEIRRTLEADGFHVEATNYGRFNLIKFLLPFGFFRRQAVAEILVWLNAVFYKNPGSKVSIIAHSFGTYIAAHVLRDNFNIKVDKIIFCGSVLRYNFPFQDFDHRFYSTILNEVGTRDVWPAVAESVTTGYGSAGSFGFRRPFVHDRWHNGAGHGFFLNEKFCRTFWLPFLRDGTVVPGSPSPEPPTVLIALLNVVKLKYVLVALALAGAVYNAYPHVTEFLTKYYSPPSALSDQNTCAGLPGETAWIYAGEFDQKTSRFKIEPVYIREGANLPSGAVTQGEWVRLTTSRRTMILDYDTSGTARALDSPFTLNGKVNYTCKTLAPGSRLYVADVKINGPSPEESHVWLRVRASLPGG